MKSLIILFSPSGNTYRVGELLQASLQDGNIPTKLINIAGQEKYFSTTDKQNFLKEIWEQHDILFIGSPVYAHHLQYHVKDVINHLPQPDDQWSKYAIPFVTYGGIDSGIALEEAAKLLKKSGRTVLAGLKVSCSHHMTKVFMQEEFNNHQPEDNINSLVDEMVKQINSINLRNANDQTNKMRYQSRIDFLKANIIFNEKKWHEKRYPQIVIDENICIKCGKCVTVCPVGHLKKDHDKNIVKNQDSRCIHCFNCVFTCPQRAIHPVGDLEKAKAFMEKMILRAQENPGTYLYGWGS